MHRDLSFETQGLEPRLVVSPEVAAAPADYGVAAQLLEVRRRTVPIWLGAAAI